MAVQIIHNTGVNRNATAGRLKYTIIPPGMNIPLPAQTFIAWAELNAAVDAAVVIGTTNGGNEFFDDLVSAGVPYEVNKGFKAVNETLYITTTAAFDLTIYKL